MIGHRRITKKINEMKSWFFERLSKINKHLAKWTIKKRARKHKVSTSGIGQEMPTIDIADITSSIIKKEYGQLHTNKFDR